MENLFLLIFIKSRPGADTGAELLLTGKILQSDGATLRIELRVRDSRGVEWINQVYTEIAEETAYLETERRLRRPFQDLYNRVANDLLSARQALSGKDLVDIRRVSEIRYAAALLPDAFGDFLELDEKGHYQLRRLPSREDPADGGSGGGIALTQGKGVERG